jgi:hypothetical protein
MPEDQQDLFARLVMEEIEEDAKWLRSTADNAGKHESLVRDVLAADDRGECEPLDPERL